MSIAVVGMACRFPDANSPEELWETVLAKRRAFRRLPPERLALADYFSPDPASSDAIYAAEAALLENYDFDRVRFSVAGSIFRAVDMTHWLALDVADQALRDAQLPDGEGLPRESTGVLVGNTLTGEFSRAALLRVRWPYVRRVVDARLCDEGWTAERRRAFLHSLEDLYKAPFPPVDEETLAGSLSNTIAGRICNYFHFGGGGYTLDGACCSSLLAVARACAALRAEEIDAALVGGIDLSLDPFELVGFSKAGALAHGEMLVYDQASSGFLPGEGCGFVVLLRQEDAVNRGLRCYGLIRGWGVSSDGGGSITRPEMRGQQLALQRAYRCAGYGPNTVGFFEGHGTGTPVGDGVELGALAAARRAASSTTRVATIGSIKANIGHTKAAAGLAGLMKAALALQHQLIPPNTGVKVPRPELEAGGASLRVLDEGQCWPSDQPLRAGVSAFGFGGINVHVTMEGSGHRQPKAISPREERLLSTPQDAELFLFDGEDEAGLARQVDRVRDLAPQLSIAELADVAAALEGRLKGRRFRAAVVASTPEKLGSRLGILAARLASGLSAYHDAEGGVFVGGGAPAQLGLLFPGQASPVRLHGGALARRFSLAKDLYERAALPASGDPLSTALAQPAILAASLAGLRILDSLGVQAAHAVGHSLGELPALVWAGALDEGAALALAKTRGRVMSDVGGPPGAMASISTEPAAVRELLADRQDVVIACFNAPSQVVVSGERDGVLEIVARARGRGWACQILPTSHGFHSPLMGSAREPFHKELRSCPLRPLVRRVVSTVTGRALQPDADLAELLTRQLTHPVRFQEALAHLTPGTDVWLEVGPGNVLSHLVRDVTAVPVISLDVGGSSLQGVLLVAGAIFASGGPIRTHALFDDRFTRTFDLDRPRRFLANPCETAPQLTIRREAMRSNVHPAPNPRTHIQDAPKAHPILDSPVERVRALVAQHSELPLSAVKDESRLLRDLHLNSLKVGELVVAAARQLGLPAPAAPLDLADATVADVGRALERLQAAGVTNQREPEGAPMGVDHWVRAFAVRRHARPPRATPLRAAVPGSWRLWTTPDHPLEGRLRERVSDWPGQGAVVCLSAGRVEEQIAPLLDGARDVLCADGTGRQLVVLQPAQLAGSFARTLHLENPEIITCVVQAPLVERAVEWLSDEVCRAIGHTEAWYDADGQRGEPCLERLHLEGDDAVGATEVPLKPGGLVLVSGGGKGIAAECARTLAGRFGVALALFGRSRPEEDEELTANLRRFSQEGVSFRYSSVDVTDAAAVRDVVVAAEETWGPAVAIVHGAGLNRPALLRDLSDADFERTIAPKVQGFRNLVEAVDQNRLRLLVTFGSVIGRTGMRGESDYALANACLTLLCQEFQALHSRCRCLALESSVWSDIGMGERFGRLDALRHEGITAMTPGEGTKTFLQLINQDLPPTPIVVSGRLGANPPLPVDAPPLPLLRFLERPRVHYPGVELVVEADVSNATDPYLREHVFRGQPLLPAVIGLEAMAQVAMGVTGKTRPPVFEDVRFERPVVIEDNSTVTLQLAALVRGPRVEVVLRSSQTGFQVDHFRCQCHFDWCVDDGSDPPAVPGPSRIPLDPRHDLYGGLLFQEGRFQRVVGYRHLTASFSCADIGAGSGPERAWFSEYLPPTRVLGDPAARDAALHSVQACVPHGILLPVAVDRVVPGPLSYNEAILVHARERLHDGVNYVYDVDVRGSDGYLRERWEGLRLQRVEEADRRLWPEALLAPFVEWRLRDLVPASRVLVALEREDGSHPSLLSDSIIQRALGAPGIVRRRYDGKPEVDGDLEVSAAHAGDVILAVASSSGAVSCDLERVCHRPAPVWRDLLGPERWSLAGEIARQTDGDVHNAATRVWTALECLKKAEASWNAPLTLVSCQTDGWVSLGAPGVTVATYLAELRGGASPLALAVLVSKATCAATNTVTA